MTTDLINDLEILTSLIMLINVVHFGSTLLIIKWISSWYTSNTLVYLLM